MKLSLRKLEYVWHTMAFVLLMGAFVPLWRQMTIGGIDPAEGDPVQRLFLVVAYLGVGLLMLHPRRALQVARRGWLVWVLVGCAMLSTSWSVAPYVTLRRSLAAALGALYGLLLFVRYRPEEVLRMLGVGFAIVVLASLVAVLVIPEWAVMGPLHEGAWQGVLFHKNALGRLGAFAFIVFWVLARNSRAATGLFWRGLMGATVFAILGSRSATGFILVLTVVGVWLVFQIWRQMPNMLRVAEGSLAFVLIIPAIMSLPIFVKTGLELLGKDLTLTGRIPLWLVLIPMALERPLFGYGYGAFWLGQSGPSAMVWALTWHAPHAHNGYLDLWLQLGAVGVFLEILFLLKMFIKSGKQVLVFEPHNPLWQFVMLVSVYILVSDISGSTLLESGLGKALYWIIIVYSFCCLSRNINLRQKAPNES